MGVFARLDRGEEAFVAEVVLGDGVGPDVVAEEDGVAGDAEELAEVGENFREEAVGGEVREVGLAGAAGEDSEGDVAVGGTAGEEAGGEEGAEDFAVLEGGDEGAESIEWMRDVFAAEAEEEGGDGRMKNVGERGERAFGERAVIGGGDGESGEGVGGEREEDGGETFGERGGGLRRERGHGCVERGRLPGDAPGGAEGEGRGEGRDGGGEFDGAGGEVACKGVGEHLQAVAKRD